MPLRRSLSLGCCGAAMLLCCGAAQCKRERGAPGASPGNRLGVLGATCAGAGAACAAQRTARCEAGAGQGAVGVPGLNIV
jgi:hypothetical protein